MGGKLKRIYEYLKNGELGSDIASSKYFPYTEAEEILKIPEAQKTEKQKDRLTELSKQMDKASTGVKGTISVAAGRTVDEKIKPYTEPFEKAFAWLKKNWKYLAATAVGATALFAGGTLGMIATGGLALFGANEISKHTSGKSLFDNVKTWFDKKPVSEPRIPSISHPQKPLAVAHEEKPSSYPPGQEPSWLEKAKATQVETTHTP